MRFQSWLEETIEWGEGNAVPRWKAIRYFVMEGLAPFVKSLGYEFACTEKQLCNCIATGLFDNRNRSFLESNWPKLTAGGSEEEMAHFHFVCDQEKWEKFWNIWGNWTDMNPMESSRGADRRMDIESAVWNYLDLDRSSQTLELYELMAGGDEDDAPLSRPGQQGVDSYLQDAEHNGWGGYRK